MKIISKLKYVFFLIVIAGFVSCKGEIGPVGPAGVDGTDGEDGNANVISSDWISPTWGGAMPIHYGHYKYLTDDISQEIINTGVILSYFDLLGDASKVVFMPYTNVYLTIYNYTLYVGEIEWWFYSQMAITPSTVARFRYVIIPSSGNKSADSKHAIYDELENAGIDINNYYEVMDYYGLDYAT